MKKAVTIKDVAKLAGVSVSSVSRYINNPDSINPLTAAYVKKAINELQYVPNLYARSLKSGKNKTIGVIVPDLGPFFSKVCTALSDYFYQHQYLLYICNTESSVERETYYINTLLSQQISGLVIAPADLSPVFLEKTSKLFNNMVMIEHYNTEIIADLVFEESEESTYRLVKHMIRAGHSRFQLFFRQELASNVQSRYAGAKRALQEFGLDIDKMPVSFGVKDRENIQMQITQSMAGVIRPTAIMGFSPQITENIIMALRQLNYRIPADIAVAGYLMEDYAAKYQLEIPCVVQKPYELGNIAGSVLMKRINAKKNMAAPQIHCLEATLSLPSV